jgi:rod shape-determining protein MreC
MQNLFAFLRRFRVFIFFSALQFLCLVLYVQFVSFPKSVYLSTASTFNGKIQSVEGKLTSHFDLEENNTALRLENAQLRKRVFTNFYRVDRAKVQVNDTVYEQSFSYIPTKIINGSVVLARIAFQYNIQRLTVS